MRRLLHPTGEFPDTDTKDPTPAERTRPLTRRDFLRLSVGGVSVLCFYPLTGCNEESPPKVEGKSEFGLSGRPIEVDASSTDHRLPIVWVETGVCTGCGCSLLDCLTPPAELLLPDIRLAYQETLMDDWGRRAMEQLRSFSRGESGDYLLIVDGAIPVGNAARMTTVGASLDGQELTAQEVVSGLAAKATQVVAAGTCACFGGIPGSAPYAGQYVSLAEAIGTTPIRIPGCPPNPAWLAGALTTLLGGGSLQCDSLGRPGAFFQATVHELCPRKERFSAGDFASAPGDPERCLYKVGCKGIITYGDCPSRRWQDRSYCIGVGSVCIGCTSPGFLDSRSEVDGHEVGAEAIAAAPFFERFED